MSGATFTLPGPILDMLAKGLHEMPTPNSYVVHNTEGWRQEVSHVFLVTDAGDELTFLRAQDMERT